MPEWGAYLIIGLAALGAIFGVGKWVGAVNADRISFKTFMNEVRKDIKEILQRLPAKVVTGQSPVRLTDLGKRVSECLDAPSIVRGLASELIDRVAGKPDYEVQEMCFSYIDEEYTPPPEVETVVRKCAYEHGIERDQVMRVLGVELRDQLLHS